VWPRAVRPPQSAETVGDVYDVAETVGGVYGVAAPGSETVGVFCILLI
jgi:hypothetical protein